MVISTPSLDEYNQTLLHLLPDQGRWSDDDYLWLTECTTRLVELTDGDIEVLPMPTDNHQGIAEFMFLALTLFIRPLGGTVHIAPLRLRIRPGKFREPDVLAVLSAKDKRRRNRFWTGADLTLEVVSKDKPERDLVVKRHDYAEGKVSEYWIVNPQTETITVLRLENDSYVEHGVFGRGQSATSVVMPNFAVSVNEVFDVDSPPDDPNDDD